MGDGLALAQPALERGQPALGQVLGRAEAELLAEPALQVAGAEADGGAERVEAQLLGVQELAGAFEAGVGVGNGAGFHALRLAGARRAGYPDLAVSVTPPRPWPGG